MHRAEGLRANERRGSLTSLINNSVHEAMAFISKHSCECTKSELDLFSVPPTQTSILKGQWVQYNPLTNIVDSDSIEFNITGSTEHYLDLAHTLLNVKAKVVNENGTDLGDDVPVGPVNLMLHSLFSEVDVTLNDKLISSSSNTYPYRACWKRC